MKTVYNAFYLSVFLYFARKILDKVTLDLNDSIRRHSHDSSGCWNVCVRGVPVFYTYEKGLALEVARRIHEDVVGLQGPDDIEIVEDDSLPTCEPEEVPGLNSMDCCELGLVLSANED